MTGESGGAATRLRFGATTLGAAAALFMAVAGATSSGSASAETSRFLPWTEAPPVAVILKDLAGRPTSITDYPGKVVIVSFWATWCEFCREQMLAMRRLREQLAGQPFEIVAANYGESPAKVREYVQSLSVEFPVILDPSQMALGRGGCGSSQSASWWPRTAGPVTRCSASSTGRAARPSRRFASCYAEPYSRRPGRGTFVNVDEHPGVAPVCGFWPRSSAPSRRNQLRTFGPRVRYALIVHG
jgi:thiol-disulfide isomerase/thioredoxin